MTLTKNSPVTTKYTWQRVDFTVAGFRSVCHFMFVCLKRTIVLFRCVVSLRLSRFDLTHPAARCHVVRDTVRCVFVSLTTTCSCTFLFGHWSHHDATFFIEAHQAPERLVESDPHR